MTAKLVHISDTHLWDNNYPKPTVLVVKLKGHNENSWEAIWKFISDVKPDAILWSGDVATAQNENSYNIAMDHVNYHASVPCKILQARSGPPIYCVPGNHDHYSVIGRPVLYVRSTSTYAECFNDPNPSITHQVIGGRDFFFFRIDTCSGIKGNESIRTAAGRVHSRDLEKINGWMTLAKSGGEVDGVRYSPTDFINSVNILIMHHDLLAEDFFHLLEQKSRTVLLKLIAAIPIHLVACGHTHDCGSGDFSVFGPGRLDNRQKRALRHQRILNTEIFKVSNAGTTSQEDVNSNTANVIRIGDQIEVAECRFDGTEFVD